MSDQARVKDVADAVAAKVLALWNAGLTLPAVVTAPDAVASTWLARLSYDADDAATLTLGRRVFAVPGEVRLVPLTRGLWRNGYTVGVVVAELYTGTGDPPDAWIDERVTWWQDTILYPLGNPELVLEGPAGKVPACQPDPETPPEVTALVERDYLTELKVLFLAANFAFIDQCDHTGAG